MTGQVNFQVFFDLHLLKGATTEEDGFGKRVYFPSKLIAADIQDHSLELFVFMLS
jgi:hypothetical protein